MLTGSANLLAMRHVADSLAGRAGYLEMTPMTRGELLGFGTTGAWNTFWETPFDDWQEWIASNDAIPADWRDLARHGGFPVPALQLDEAGRHEWFAGYMATYLERDQRAVSAVDSLRNRDQTTGSISGTSFKSTTIAVGALCSFTAATRRSARATAYS